MLEGGCGPASVGVNSMMRGFRIRLPILEPTEKHVVVKLRTCSHKSTPERHHFRYMASCMWGNIEFDALSAAPLFFSCTGPEGSIGIGK
jgi:hypothetical protein